MTPAEHDAMRDLAWNAEIARQAAREQKDKAKQLRLRVGALHLEAVAALNAFKDRLASL